MTPTRDELARAAREFLEAGEAIVPVAVLTEHDAALAHWIKAKERLGHLVALVLDGAPEPDAVVRSE